MINSLDLCLLAALVNNRGMLEPMRTCNGLKFRYARMPAPPVAFSPPQVANKRIVPNKGLKLDARVALVNDRRPHNDIVAQEAMVPEIADIMIAGQPIEPAGSGTWIVTNPSNLRPLGTVRNSDEQQWRAALHAAQGASTGWGRLQTEQRARFLAEVSEGLLTSQREIAVLHSRETGQVIAESIDMVHLAASYWRVEPTRTVVTGTSPVCLIRPRPDAALLDWSHFVAKRLASGSCCVVALPPQAPLTVLTAMTACKTLPRGVLSVLVGEPAGTMDNNVEAVSPTDTPTASDIVYVSSDADLDLAAAGAAAKRLYRSGQCAEQSVRVYVEQAQTYPFADRMHTYLAFLEAGDPVKSASDLGPMSSLDRIEEVQTRVADTLKKGALLKLGGRRYQPWGLTGYYFQPTLMIEGSGEERAPHDQIRGPVILLTPVRNLAAALADRPATGTLRVTLFARDIERTLAHINLDTKRIDFEHVTERRENWFPYHARAARQ